MNIKTILILIITLTKSLLAVSQCLHGIECAKNISKVSDEDISIAINDYMANEPVNGTILLVTFNQTDTSSLVVIDATLDVLHVFKSRPDCFWISKKTISYIYNPHSGYITDTSFFRQVFENTIPIINLPVLEVEWENGDIPKIVNLAQLRLEILYDPNKYEYHIVNGKIILKRDITNSE